MASTFVGNIAGKGKKAPGGTGGERGAARRGGGAAAGKEKPEKQAVMRMQNLLNSLSKELDTNQEKVIRVLSTQEKPVNEATMKGWSGVLADTGIPGRGKASNDGIWGRKTAKACAAAEEIAKLVRARGRKIPEIVAGPKYNETDAKTLIANSEKNISALVSLMRALGLAVPAGMAGTETMLDKVPINLQQENVDPRTVKPGQAAYPLTIGNLRDLRSAYAWLMGLFGGGSAGVQFEPLKPVATKSPEQLRKLASEIRNSLIVRLGQGGAPTDREGLLRRERAVREGWQTKADKPKPGARGPNAGPRPEDLPRGGGSRPAPTYEGKAQSQPAQTKQPTQTKPENKPTAHGDLTVAQFENGLRWILQRADKTFLQVNDAFRMGEKLAYKGDKEITAADVKMADYYRRLAERLMELWQNEKQTFRPEGAKTGWERTAYIDSALLGMGRGPAGGAGREWGATRRGDRGGRGGRGGYGAGGAGVGGASLRGPLGTRLYIPDLTSWLQESRSGTKDADWLNEESRRGMVYLDQFENSNAWDLAPRYVKHRQPDDPNLAKWFFKFNKVLQRALNTAYQYWESTAAPHERDPRFNKAIDQQSKLMARWNTALNNMADRANAWMGAGTK